MRNGTEASVLYPPFACTKHFFKPIELLRISLIHYLFISLLNSMGIDAEQQIRVPGLFDLLEDEQQTGVA